MFEILIVLTGAVCIGGAAHGYLKYRDPFHPLVLMLPMCAFVYFLMPWLLGRDGALFSYVSHEQAAWVQGIIVAGIMLLIGGLHMGSSARIRETTFNRFLSVDVDRLHHGAYILGTLGVLAWSYGIRNVGGISGAFSVAKGMGWSEFGYIREAAYLMIVALLLLLSPQGFQPKNRLWCAAVVLCSLPYLMQGLLGAQRGPTFLIVTTLGMSYYLARGRRPSLPVVLGGGAALGFLLLLLVTNRGNIYLGSDNEIDPNVSGFFSASEANEYIFGAGCMIAARQTDHYFWGRRYLAQVLVRPIPRQLWPNKYEDFGVPELLRNAGVAGDGLSSVMGWGEIPGAAAAMVADLWVEFSWFALPVLFGVGYQVGHMWRKAVLLSGPFATQYMIFVLLSVFFISQSGEAVIFRLVILSLPAWFVWRRSMVQR